ncbi:hypothetical protein BLNAU_22978 [Blattamonas nauphoetae]|uniref:Uncharacterized protein n=1 Tax=Blattamonas nauphoetae TaxID=2049346 RepID=A0ABQ9WRJ8_9EUKA|nr:hypothetical protein BLNAU_22978 [Blattamonas nauphoetae]
MQTAFYRLQPFVQHVNFQLVTSNPLCRAERIGTEFVGHGVQERVISITTPPLSGVKAVIHPSKKLRVLQCSRSTAPKSALKVQRQLQGEIQLAKLASPNQRSQPLFRNSPHQQNSSLFGRGGRSGTPGRESSSWRMLPNRPTQKQSHKQFPPRRDGGSGQEGGKI